MRLLAALTTSFTLKVVRLLSTVELSLQVEVAGGVLQVPARPRVLGWGCRGHGGLQAACL